MVKLDVGLREQSLDYDMSLVGGNSSSMSCGGQSSQLPYWASIPPEECTN